jgi:hypothetical protein
MNNSSDHPKSLSSDNVKNIVKIGNSLLPMLSKKEKDREKEASVISYLLSSVRNKNISKQGRDVVNHADLFNWNDLKNKDRDDD